MVAAVWGYWKWGSTCLCPCPMLLIVVSVWMQLVIVLMLPVLLFCWSFALVCFAYVGFLPNCGCLTFGCCCSFWFFVAICSISSFDHFVFAVSFLYVLFLRLLLVSISDLGLLGALVVGGFNIRDSPGISWGLFVVGCFPIATDVLFCLVGLASSKQNFLIFSWFLLFSSIFLHATMWIKRGFVSGNGLVSVAIAMSFFLITVFFLNGESIVMICGV